MSFRTCGRFNRAAVLAAGCKLRAKHAALWGFGELFRVQGRRSAKCEVVKNKSSENSAPRPRRPSASAVWSSVGTKRSPTDASGDGEGRLASAAADSHLQIHTAEHEEVPSTDGGLQQTSKTTRSWNNLTRSDSRRRGGRGPLAPPTNLTQRCVVFQRLAASCPVCLSFCSSSIPPALSNWWPWWWEEEEVLLVVEVCLSLTPADVSSWGCKHHTGCCN